MKTIVFAMLLAMFVSPAYSQTDSVRIWITPEQEAKVFRLMEDFRAVQVGYAFLEQDNKKLRLQNDSLRNLIFEIRQKVDSLHKVLYRDSAKISHLQDQLQRSYKIVATKDATAKKWERRYYENIKYRKVFVFNSARKWVEILISAACFGGAMYGVMILTR